MSELCFVSPGTLEDWDLAIQKTETRLARVNEQRMKVTAGLPKGWERHCSAPVVCFGSFVCMDVYTMCGQWSEASIRFWDWSVRQL